MKPHWPQGNLWFMAGDVFPWDTWPGDAGRRQAGRVHPTRMWTGQRHGLEGTRASIHLLLEEMWVTHGHLQPSVPTRAFVFAAVAATPAAPLATLSPWISSTMMEHTPATNATTKG